MGLNDVTLPRRYGFFSPQVWVFLDVFTVSRQLFPAGMGFSLNHRLQVNVNCCQSDTNAPDFFPAGMVFLSKTIPAGKKGLEVNRLAQPHSILSVGRSLELNLVIPLRLVENGMAELREKFGS